MHSILKEGRLARLVNNFDQDSNISEIRMKADLFRHTLSQEMAFFDSRTVSSASFMRVNHLELYPLYSDVGDNMSTLK